MPGKSFCHPANDNSDNWKKAASSHLRNLYILAALDFGKQQPDKNILECGLNCIKIGHKWCFSFKDSSSSLDVSAYNILQLFSKNLTLKCFKSPIFK